MLNVLETPYPVCLQIPPSLSLLQSGCIKPRNLISKTRSRSKSSASSVVPRTLSSRLYSTCSQASPYLNGIRECHLHRLPHLAPLAGQLLSVAQLSSFCALRFPGQLFFGSSIAVPRPAKGIPVAVSRPIWGLSCSLNCGFLINSVLPVFPICNIISC